MLEEKDILLYDGYCALCNYAVKKVLKWDKKNRVLLSPLTSQKSQELLTNYKISMDTDSIILIQNGKAFVASRAVIQLMKKIRPFHFFAVILRVLPVSIADRLYKLVAKNRYSWFGKYDTCPMVSEKDRHKMLY